MSRAETLPFTYQSIGHRGISEDYDSWAWMGGKLLFASKEGADPDYFHGELFTQTIEDNEPRPPFTGRIDYTSNQASIQGRRDDERGAIFVAKRLADHIPEDMGIWYFSDQGAKRIA